MSKIIESRIGIRVFLENDSRAMAYGEFSVGAVTFEKNVASGWALTRMLKERLKEGATSILTQKNANPNLNMESIIAAANNDDVLAIEMIAKIGDNLGRGIALLINLFNPELVILGGCLSATEDYIKLPIKSAINKYSLSLMNTDTALKISTLGERGGIFGACLLTRNRLFNIV